MYKYVMALDAGTTSNRCIIFNRSGDICSMSQKEFTQYYPKPGWVEHDAEEIWHTMLSTVDEAMKKLNACAEDIAAIGITNQRETVILWDRSTGKPICPAIVWQCRRTADFVKELSEKAPVLDKVFRQKTGLTLDPYFSGTKIRWLLDNIKGAREKAENGELCFGTVDSWLIYKLTNGKVHATDQSNASRTLLYNIVDLKWDDELCGILDIPQRILPEVRDSSGIYGETDKDIFGGAIKIAGVAGDQQAALFGQACFEPGEAKNTYGTGCFLLMNTGDKPVYSKNKLLTTIAWGVDGKITYALEGSVYVAGAAVQWLRDEMRLIDTASESEYFAKQVQDTNGCYVVPAFTGMGAPYWDSYARGMITGLTRGTNKCHIIRATLESLAYQTHDVLKAMEQDMGKQMKMLKVDGGASKNNFLMQFQSDMIGKSVIRPECVETTAKGAAYLAGLGVGFWRDISDIEKNMRVDKEFDPAMNIADRERSLEGWRRAVSAVLAF
ncbi:MAG: glycerol kinase GlpK [Clostridia bacterium]|nr:glycerol kinase GlpK [Clostridia bacterium]